MTVPDGTRHSPPLPAARAERRFRLDGTARVHGSVVIGGSPLTLFRLTDAGRRVVDRIVGGDAVGESALTEALLEAGAIHPEPGTARLGPADVTVVIPTIEPPLADPGAAVGCVVVVDDAAEPPVHGATIRLDRNRGPAAARNAGLALVATPLVAFVDADVALPPGWLDPLLPHFDDPRVALVAPRVRSEPGPTALARYERGHSPLDLGAEPARVRAGTRVGYVPAAAIVVRVDALRSVGGFDDSMRFGEDVDLVWRLDEAGWRCRYEPRSTVTHRPRPDWATWLRQRVGYGSSAAPLARRHPGALAPLRMNGWSIGAWALAVLGRPLAGAAVGVGSSIALVGRLRDVPARESLRLAGLGNLRAGDQIAEAVRRVWWPIVAVAALRSRAARRLLVGTAIAARHPVGVVDDVAYSVGVWRGVVRERTAAPLVPEIRSWPGRAGRGARR